MSGRSVILAVEDMLSEVVCTRILNRFGINISQQLGLKGKGYLQQKVRSLNQLAKAYPVFVLADLDTPKQCPPQLIQSWIKEKQNAEFFLRVAVMEVESWILADRRGIANFLSIPLNRIPSDTDSIPQPKEFLVSLARRSRKNRLREDLVPAKSATSIVGPGYNSRIGDFVRTCWNLEHAADVSTSLRRTMERLSDFG